MLNRDSIEQFLRFICGLDNQYRSQQLIPIKVERDDVYAQRSAERNAYERRRGYDDSR